MPMGRPITLIILTMFIFGCCSLPPLVEQCDDGTFYGECSDEQPKFCQDGQLIDDANLCGCPDEFFPDENNSCSIFVFKCYDGTPYGKCTQTKPKYCSNGVLADNATTCGCPEGKNMLGDSCIIPPANFTYTIYEDKDPYYRIYCDKIDPYDLSIREAASDAIRKHPGAYNANQIFDIYDWVKQNVIYQNVPLGGIPYPPSETLDTGSGDCKNQAVLIASMIESIGGTARVTIDGNCSHAYAMVYYGPSGTDMVPFTEAVATHYGPDVNVRYMTYDDGIWIILDPAGGLYPGNTLPECTGDRTVHFISGCLDCSREHHDKPHKYDGLCYSQCPSGTVSLSDYTCTPCPEGSGSCNNQCLTCPEGTHLGKDCKCYRS